MFYEVQCIIAPCTRISIVFMYYLRMFISGLTLECLYGIHFSHLLAWIAASCY